MAEQELSELKSLLAVAPGPVLAWVVSYTGIFQNTFFAPVEYFEVAELSAAALSTVLTIISWHLFSKSPVHRLRIASIAMLALFVLLFVICTVFYFYLAEPRDREIVERIYLVWAISYTIGMTAAIVAIVFAILSAVGRMDGRAG